MASLTWKDDTEVLVFECVKSERHKSKSEVTEFPVESGAPVSDHIRALPSTVGLSVFVSNSPLRGGSPKSYSGKAPRYTRSVENIPITVPKAKGFIGLSPGGLAVAAIDAIGEAILGDGLPTKFQGSSWNERSSELKWAGNDIKHGGKDFRIELIDKLEKLRDTKETLKVITALAVYPDCQLTEVSFDRNRSGDGLRIELEFARMRIVDTKQVAAPRVRVSRAQVKAPKGDPGQDTNDPASRTAMLQKIREALLKGLPK